MGKSIWDTITSPITAPLNIGAGVTHGLSNALGKIPVVGGLAKYGGIGISDLLHGGSEAVQGDLHQSGKDFSSSISNAIHGPNTIPVVGPYILPAVAGVFGGPLAAGAASGIQNGFEASRRGVPMGRAALGGAESGALSAAASYAGGQLGSELNGVGSSPNPISGGTSPGFLGTPVSQSLSDTALSGVGDALGNTTPGDIIGSAVGANLGQGSAASTLDPLASPKSSSPAWSPSQMAKMDLPSSLSSYQNLDPFQQATNIASRGVYGGGQGPQETNYFLNLINRNLVGANGQVANDTSSINPVENSFLNQIGLGGYKNPTDLLHNISNYQFS